MALVLFAACRVEAPDSSVVQSVPPVSEAPPPEPEPEPEPPNPLDTPLPLAGEVTALTGLARPEGMLEGQRPVAVMVATDARSLPQRGLAAADVLVEMLTEGGITRLMALYDDYRTMPQVGPVRSTRDQFLQFGLPVNAIFSHIGTSTYARNLLDVLAYKTVDGLSLGRTAFWFDEVRYDPLSGKLKEHCWFTDAGLLWAGMEVLDVYTTGEVRTLFHFSDVPTPPEGQANSILAAFSAAAASGFVYDAATGLYTKTIFENVHADEDGTPLQYTNVLLLECGISLKPDGLVTEFDMSGGSGWYFTAGGVKPLTWVKGNPQDALRLFDAVGEEIAVARGKSYVGMLPAGAVSYS